MKKKTTKAFRNESEVKPKCLKGLKTKSAPK